MSKKGWHKFIQGIGWVFPAYHASIDGIKQADHGQGWIDHATGASDAEREGRIHYDYGGLTQEQYDAWLKYKQQTPTEQHAEALADVKKHRRERQETQWAKEDAAAELKWRHDNPNPTAHDLAAHQAAVAAKRYYREHPDELVVMLDNVQDAMNEIIAEHGGKS